MDFRRPRIPALAFVISSIIYLFVQDVSAECTPDRAKNYTIIPEDQYLMNYTVIGTEGKRPYGFDQSIWEYNAPPSQNPCVHITGTSNRRVEIMVETEPPNRLCMRAQTYPDVCFDNQEYRCLKSVEDDFYLEFFCDDRCSELGVPFWYRLVIGDSPDIDKEDEWCDDRSRDQYPSNLQQLPPNFAIPTTTPKDPGNSGLVTVPSIILSLMLMVCALLL